MEFTITGKLHARMETQQVTDTFRKREFVVEFAENPLYPQHIQFQLVQDRVELLDPYKVGDTISVTFNLRGRSWTSPTNEVKYFTTLEAWRINPAAGEQPQPVHAAAQPVATGVPVTEVTAQDDDDLPF